MQTLDLISYHHFIPLHFMSYEFIRSIINLLSSVPLISPHLISFHFISSHLIHSFVFLYVINSFISFRFTEFRFISFHFIPSFIPSLHSLAHAFTYRFFHAIDFICFHFISWASRNPFAHSLMHLTSSIFYCFCISQTFLDAIDFLSSMLFFET